MLDVESQNVEKTCGGKGGNMHTFKERGQEPNQEPSCYEACSETPDPGWFDKGRLVQTLMDRPDRCEESHPMCLFFFFHVYHIKSQLLDKKSHLCVIWGPSGSHPAALELALSRKVIAGQPRGRRDRTRKTRTPNVLTEKILTAPVSSSSQMNFALLLVRRSSSRRGGFTNTTYGMNSSEDTCFIFCRAEEEGGGRGGAVTFHRNQLGSIKLLGILSLFLKYTLNEITKAASE